MNREQPIGIFDSGIGGMSVYRKIREILPGESILYFADQGNMPYGSKDLEEVLHYAQRITAFLLQKGCKIIVIACNTACAAALHPLRKLYPMTLFVGMEPAVKPAAELTRSGVVGILATEGTFKGDPYAGVVKRFARGVKILEQPCTGLAEAIEQGEDITSIRRMLRHWIEPLQQQGADQLALACTHYPLILEHIIDIAGNRINVIDPAAAIARRVASLLEDYSGLSKTGFEGCFFTTAPKIAKQSVIVTGEFTNITYCHWTEDKCLI